MEQKLAHEDEERDGYKRIGRGAVEGVADQKLHARRSAEHEPGADHVHGEEGKNDRDPRHHQQDDGAEENGEREFPGHRPVYGTFAGDAAPAKGRNVWLTISLREGKYREVRKVLAHLGLAVNRLIRVAYGPFQLGDLPRGAGEEVPWKALREQLGPIVAAASGAPRETPRGRSKGRRR